MSKNLVIVESPEKAKTIGKFLGSDYVVMSSRGHVRDIEGMGKNSMGIDFEHGYAPNYVVDPQKHQLLNQLKEEAKKADMVWLASDEDREGEAIAWHLQQVLELDEKNTRRIVFHEITKTAIQEAIQHPRTIDYNLVHAQQARRVIDRIVGFELSPVLWKKVTTGLSAGRVQSVTVRLIVEREREISSFRESAQYRLTADFTGSGASSQVIRTELNHRFATKEEALAFLAQCKDGSFEVLSITQKPAHRSPAPPFTTSSLQQEASRKLKFPVSKTMRLAQALYEAGKITYMRTDSVNLSSLALGTAREEIVKEYGERYHKTRQYHTTAKGAQEAHEAIRPTFMSERTAGENNDERRLYELIWKRTLACQMADAEMMNTRIEIGNTNLPYVFAATGEVVLFDGFMRAYIQSTDDETEQQSSTLPPVTEKEPMMVQEIVAQESFTKAPFRYTEASLVHKMEEIGIGRPSTYASIIETIQLRKYVERGNVVGKKREYNVLTMKNGHLSDKMKTETVGNDTGKLLPTDLGCITNDFLVEQFPNILSYDFTAKEEENFDEIAEGHAEWVSTVDAFYQTFHPAILKVPSGKVAGRLLGHDPKTNEPVYAKISKIGPCIQIGDADVDKPRFVSLGKGMSVFTVTLDEALSLFADAQPHALMVIDGNEVVAGEGKYGAYIRYDGQFISIPKGMEASKMSEEDVRQLIQKHHDLQKPLMEWGSIQVMDGRYGAYIKTPDGNYRLPKGTDVKELTEERCQEIIAASVPTGKSKSKTASESTTKKTGKKSRKVK